MSTNEEETKNETSLCNEIDGLNLNDETKKSNSSDVNDAKVEVENPEKCPHKNSGCKNNVKIGTEEKNQIPKGFWPNYVRSVEKYLADMEKEANVRSKSFLKLICKFRIPGFLKMNKDNFNRNSKRQS